MISFECDRTEHDKIAAIVTRAEAKAESMGVPFHRPSVMMDITAAHCNGCALDLDKLAEAPDFDFVHDVWGISRHINRRTGKLEDCFAPRCAFIL